MRILVVDDDQISREMIAYALSQDGHEILTASDGGEALEIVAQGKCRIVITDYLMPGVNGRTLCKSIRNGEFGAYVYIILISGSRTEQSDLVAGLAAGADDFLTKPLDPAELRIRIRAAARILGLETRDATIFTLAKSVEARDAHSGDHLERMRRYTRLLGEQLAGQPPFRGLIDGEYLRLLFMTSPLHDIGKVAIEDAVLLKPGQLTASEFEVMKSHAIKGAETLEAALASDPDSPFLQMARDIAATHHERYDGTGYPRGLKGDEIPLAGRIVAVADVYDALTSERVYKDAFSHEQARNLIVSGSRSQFDPDVVMAFQAVEEQFLEVREEFADELPALA
jgi:putative two-component system response regulator